MERIGVKRRRALPKDCEAARGGNIPADRIGKGNQEPGGVSGYFCIERVLLATGWAC